MTKPWDVYEATIKDLYADNTLSVVRQIMIDQYGFRASVRAYRGRLIRWGVRKYNCRKRASPSASNSSADDGSSFTSGSDTASPIMAAAAAAAVGDARAILPRVMMKQGNVDGQLAMPVRMNQQYGQSHQHQVFSTDNSFDSKPRAFLSAPQHNTNSSSSSDGIQYGWDTALLKKDPDVAAADADLDDFTSSPQSEALAPPPLYFSTLTASMMQPGTGNNKPPYGTGYGGSTPTQHQHHRNTGGGGSLNYYNSLPSQQQRQQQVRSGVVAVNQVPPDMSFAAQTRGYGHGPRPTIGG
ncbi:hypothetical protein F4813DRAFT_364117 [Daldinia decipiens]|uniref:uncharacterized protein n=1 Tax=Daldinia decipiens TaxID=326647 RepID=UPI0020C2C64E|nr:uncharacterized protein F4813DRAFT_364117 [Daldinia decipiens]KAI1656364.1 hypothetical protein F4813DRAFT_364117 [Daldinia decipiens]